MGSVDAQDLLQFILTVENTIAHIIMDSDRLIMQPNPVRRFCYYYSPINLEPLP